MTDQAGFRVDRFDTKRRSQLAFSDWVRTSGTDAASVRLLRERFLGAPPDLRDALQIRLEDEEIHFSWMLTILLARRG